MTERSDKENTVNVERKGMSYTSVVDQKLMHGFKCRTLVKKKKEIKIKVAETKTVKWMRYDVIRLDKIRNKYVYIYKYRIRSLTITIGKMRENRSRLFEDVSIEQIIIRQWSRRRVKYECRIKSGKC